MSQNAIDVRDLRHAYGDLEAVRGVSFTVGRGEILCLLGPNGAGKTTTVEILEGYRRPTAGHVRVLGEDPAAGSRALRDRIGIVLQQTGVQTMLSVAELVDMYGGWYTRRRPTGELLALVGLEAKAGERAERLSGGQRRRLDLALALVGDPDLLFLDEPTTGFDPEARRRTWATVRALADAGTTVLLTTHFMDEAQALADRIAVLRAGELVALGAPDELGGRGAAPTEIRFALPAGVGLAGLPRLDGVAAREGRPGHALLTAPEGVAALHGLTAWALAGGHDLAGLTVTRPSLEDVYLDLTTTAEEAAA